MTWSQQLVARSAVWGRAPSAHNTQPWVVQVDPEADALRLRWDEQRHLRVGDPTRRDLMLGLGCVAESIRLVGAELGHRLEVAWDVDLPATSAGVVRRVGDTLEPEPWGTKDLLSRRTARSAYRSPWVSAEEVTALAGRARVPSGLGLDPVDPDWVERWLPIADRWVLEGPAARELGDWIRLNARHPRYDQDGLTDRTLGLSRVEAAIFGAALRAPVRAVLSWTRAMRLLAASATARPLGSVVALTATTPTLPGSPEAVAEAGQALLRVWLAAADAQWSAHPVSALLDCPASLASWPDPGRAPLAIFRLGHATEPAPASSRRPL